MRYLVYSRGDPRFLVATWFVVNLRSWSSRLNSLAQALRFSLLKLSSPFFPQWRCTDSKLQNLFQVCVALSLRWSCHTFVLRIEMRCSRWWTSSSKSFSFYKIEGSNENVVSPQSWEVRVSIRSITPKWLHLRMCVIAVHFLMSMRWFRWSVVGWAEVQNCDMEMSFHRFVCDDRFRNWWLERCHFV